MQSQKNMSKIKRLSILLFVLAALILISFHEHFIIATATKQLQITFPGSSVSIGSCTLMPLHALELADIELKKEKVYTIRLKKIRIDYTLASLFKNLITHATLGNITVDINTPHKNLLEFKNHIKLAAKPFFKVQTIEAANVSFNIQAQDIRLRATLSSTVDALRQTINQLTIAVDSFVLGDVHLEKAYCTANRDTSSGELVVKEIGYKKAIIEDLHGKIGLYGDTISLTQLNAHLFEGRIEGNATLNARNVPGYTLNVRFFDLNAAMIPEDFELKDKFMITGRWCGNFECAGKGANINFFDGNFSALLPGGSLTITDIKFLQDMALRTGIPEDILVERFKDYYYNKGAMDVSLDNDALVFGIVLEGEKGRSNFKINLHDALSGMFKVLNQGGGGA
jgi:hypothetical protein